MGRCELGRKDALSLPGLWKGWISLTGASMSVRNSPDTAKVRMNSLFTPLGHVTNHETSAPRREK